MKRLTAIEILILLALIGIAAAIVVPIYQQKFRPARPFSDSSGRVTVVLPKGWTEVPSLNPLANLKVGDSNADIYLIVVSEKKSDIQGDNHTLQKYSQNGRARLTDTMKGVRQDGPWWITVGKHRAVRYEIFGTSADGMAVAYVHTVVETPEYFHQVVGWAQTPNYEKNRKALLQVSDSFREAGDPM